MEDLPAQLRVCCSQTVPNSPSPPPVATLVGNAGKGLDLRLSCKSHGFSDSPLARYLSCGGAAQVTVVLDACARSPPPLMDTGGRDDRFSRRHGRWVHSIDLPGAGCTAARLPAFAGSSYAPQSSLQNDPRFRSYSPRRFTGGGLQNPEPFVNSLAGPGQDVASDCRKQMIMATP